MLRYVIRRSLAVLALMVAVLVVTFGIFFAIPANPAVKSCGKTCTPERLHEVEKKLGLDKSVPEQFAIYVKGIFKGRDFGEGDLVDHCPAPCLGYSFVDDQPVTTLIKDRFPVTLSLTIGAAVLWLLFGLLSGLIAALKQGTNIDRGILAVATASLSLPVQLIGLGLLYVVCAKGGVTYPHYVSFKGDPLGWAGNLLMPWATLAFLYSATYTRLARTQMIEVLQEDYIRTARGKGLSERRVALRHGARAAFPPLIIIFGLDLGGLLGGAIITERIFGMPGLGSLAIKAINQLDLPVILGSTLFAAFVILLANLVVDVVYAATDPKVSVS